MLVELGLVEQRYKAVIEVLDGAASVTDVARRYGVGRQTVHAWLRRYAAEGLPCGNDNSIWPHRDDEFWPHPRGRDQLVCAPPLVAVVTRRR